MRLLPKNTCSQPLLHIKAPASAANNEQESSQIIPANSKKHARKNAGMLYQASVIAQPLLGGRLTYQIIQRFLITDTQQKTKLITQVPGVVPLVTIELGKTDFPIMNIVV